MLNKNVIIFIFSFFCLLSMNAAAKAMISIENTNEYDDGVVLEVLYTKPSSAFRADASITVNIKKGFGPYKIVVVSNTTLGTFVKEGGESTVIENLPAGFYILYVTDSKNQTGEYQLKID